MTGLVLKVAPESDAPGSHTHPALGRPGMDGLSAPSHYESPGPCPVRATALHRFPGRFV